MKKIFKPSMYLIFIILACSIFAFASCGNANDTNTDTQEPEPAKYTVSYYNDTGTILLAQVKVSEGEAAVYDGTVPYKIPTQDTGYIFDKWVNAPASDVEVDLSSITSDVFVYAHFITTTEQHVITFMDYDGSILSVQTVFHCNPAVEPKVDSREGFAFAGWGTDISSIKEDVTVSAQYKREYHVTFKDFDGSILSEGIVLEGESAIAPEIPAREGFLFTGWDSDFSNVDKSITVTAQYDITMHTVTFKSPDGEIIEVVENVYHGFAVKEPQTDTAFFDWKEMRAYTFTGWSQDISMVTEDMVVTATYGESVSDPIIIIETCEAKRGETEIPVYMYLCGDFTMYGLSIEIQYDNELEITEDAINLRAGSLNVANQTTSKLDLANSTFEFCWSSGVPVSTDGRMSLFSFTFSIDKYADFGEYKISFLENTYFINDKLEKVTPFIASGAIIIVE